MDVFDRARTEIFRRPERGEFFMCLISLETKRLSILETLPLDPKRRVMLIKCDDQEHMVLIGPNNEQTLSVTGPETDKPNKISNLSVIGNSQLSSGR